MQPDRSAFVPIFIAVLDILLALKDEEDVKTFWLVIPVVIMVLIIWVAYLKVREILHFCYAWFREECKIGQNRNNTADQWNANRL